MYVIGITGLSCSGKTHLSENLRKVLGENECLMISMDDYYKELTEEQSKLLYNDEAAINFDEPNAIDFDLLKSHLNDLLNKKITILPKYDLGSCVITERITVDPTKYKYIILEGVFIFCNEDLLKLCNLKIWTDCSDYICALRRFIKYTRDIQGYTADFVYNQCVKYVIPGQEKYIKPTRLLCDYTYNAENEDIKYIEMIHYLIKKNYENL